MKAQPAKREPTVAPPMARIARVLMFGILMLSFPTLAAAVCGNGIPEVGEACDDGNTAPGDCCNGSCQAEPNGSSCSDGNPCTVSDSCVSAQCTSGQSINCSALDGPCTVGVCNPATFACEAEPANEGQSCDDDDVCTIADACASGDCVGSPIDCTALEGQCTLGICNLPVSTCIAVPANGGSACDDGSTCTTGETCAAGQCTNGVPANESLPCDDANPCTTEESCTSGSCTSDTFLDCSALDGSCVEGVCNPQTAACVTQPLANGTPCDDGDLCTTAERCTSGVCGNAVPVDCSGLDGECTVGVCRATTGACEPAILANGSPCEDGDLCTTGEVCASGTCEFGSPVDCSHLDGTCSVGVCNPSTGACGATSVNNGLLCDDGSTCTAGERCTNGVCGGGSATNEGGSCDDGSICTSGETCSAGTCGDGAPANDGAACDDGDLCLVGEQCAAGSCSGGTPVDCSALDDACAVGVCNPATGTCGVQSIGEGQSCNDGSTCTVGEECTGGTCAGGVTFCSLQVTKVRLDQLRQRDLWVFNATLGAPSNFDPSEGPVELSIFGSAGNWINPVSVAALAPGVGTRWSFSGDNVPGHGWLRIRAHRRQQGGWRVRIKARAPGILPPFPQSANDFRVRFRWGGAEILTPPSTFTVLGSGGGRRYP